VIYDFSTLGLGFLILLIGVSISAGLVSRRILFPRIMDLFSKTERIDGKTLFAPRSLGWMIGLLVMWQSLDWLLENVSSSEGDFIWNNGLMETVSEISRAGFVILMLVAAYRLVDYLDAFIVVEGDNMAARRSLASVAEAIGRLAVVIVGAFVLAGLIGLNLNGMIAGLGITGLALALAAKDSVANIFGAISIIIDQPFNVGDWIIVEDVEGEVISIGLRTTMIRTGNDTIVTMPNSNITNSPVENFTMRRFRRIRPSFRFRGR
jgi:Small-conductance mechanosensitive channel